MNRIMIIGCCGSGKSVLSSKLQKVTNLPLHHLDQYYWNPNWIETPKEKWNVIVTDLAEKEKWIIDGNYGGTMDIRFDRADIIVYMDYSTVRCMWRVIKRIWKYHGTVRPDMPEGCTERFDIEFLHYVAVYNHLRRKKLLSKLKELEREKCVFRIKNNNDIESFLAEMDSTSKVQSQF